MFFKWGAAKDDMSTSNRSGPARFATLEEDSFDSLEDDKWAVVSNPNGPCAMLSHLRTNDKSLHAELHDQPRSVFNKSDWKSVKATELPRTEETRGTEKETLEGIAEDNWSARDLYAIRLRYKDKAGLHGYRISNTLRPKESVPVTLYQISDGDNQKVKTSIGTGTARFLSERALDVEIPDFITEWDAVENKDNLYDEKMTFRQFASVEHLKENIDRVADVRELYDENGRQDPLATKRRPAPRIHRWLNGTEIPVPDDSIDLGTNTIVVTKEHDWSRYVWQYCSQSCITISVCTSCLDGGELPMAHFTGRH